MGGAAGDMILQAARIAAASGHAAMANHVFAGGADEEIHLLQGCPADLEDMVRDAAAAGKKNAFRHYKLAAFEDTSRE